METGTTKGGAFGMFQDSTFKSCESSFFEITLIYPLQFVNKCIYETRQLKSHLF